MRTTQLLCVCCLFMTSAATECKGDSSCPAGKDSATLLQNIIQLAPAPAPPSAPASPLPSSPSTASWDGVDGPDDGAAAGDQGPDGLDGVFGEGITTTGYSASSCQPKECKVCQSCLEAALKGPEFVAQCRGGEKEAKAEVCQQEDNCLTNAAKKVKDCVADRFGGVLEHPTTNAGNCLMLMMCDDMIAAQCDYAGSLADNWHGKNCPAVFQITGSLTQMTANTSSSSASLLERTLRGEQKKSAEQGASLDDSPSGLTMKQRSLMQSSSGQEDKKALDESLNDKCVE